MGDFKSVRLSRSCGDQAHKQGKLANPVLAGGYPVSLASRLYRSYNSAIDIL